MAVFMKQTQIWTEEFFHYTLLCVFKFMSFLGFVNINDVKSCRSSFLSVVKGDVNIFSTDSVALGKNSATL